MRRSVVAIGNFDGVHLGHQELLATASRQAAGMGTGQGGLPVLVVTFWPHPMSVIAPAGDALPLLIPLSERIELLRRYGADEVRVVQFDRNMMGWSPERFVDTILGPLNPALVVVGQNFTFGRAAAGTSQTLVELGRNRFDVVVLPLTSVDAEQTCSTLIRRELARGAVANAARHLGRPFSLRGLVVVGDQRGRELGFPTANLPVARDMATPADGVYAGWLRRMDIPDAPRLPAAISVGSNPTFNSGNRRVESHVLDRTDLELYGVEIMVEFVDHLRGQLRFSGAGELVAQLGIDVTRTRVVLGLR